MAKLYKVKKVIISTDSDLDNLQEFLNSVDTIQFITATDGCVLIIYQEK